MRRAVVLFTAVVHLLLLDAVTKELAVLRLGDGSPPVAVAGFLNLAYVENRGCAWGMFQGQVWLLAAFAAVALAALAWKRREVFMADASGWRRVAGRVAEALLYAGILGNFIDRVWRGYVIDFIDFHWGASHFPCFNVADSYITVAAALLVAMSFGAKTQGEAKGAA